MEPQLCTDKCCIYMSLSIVYGNYGPTIVDFSEICRCFETNCVSNEFDLVLKIVVVVCVKYIKQYSSQICVHIVTYYSNPGLT